MRALTQYDASIWRTRSLYCCSVAAEQVNTCSAAYSSLDRVFPGSPALSAQGMYPIARHRGTLARQAMRLITMNAYDMDTTFLCSINPPAAASAVR